MLQSYSLNIVSKIICNFYNLLFPKYCFIKSCKKYLLILLVIATFDATKLQKNIYLRIV